MAKADRGEPGGGEHAAPCAPDDVYVPPLPDEVRVNPIRDAADWRAMRDACASDPGAFHGAIAARTLHWHHPGLDAWLSRGDGGAWRGWAVADASPIEDELPG